MLPAASSKAAAHPAGSVLAEAGSAAAASGAHSLSAALGDGLRVFASTGPSAAIAEAKLLFGAAEVARPRITFALISPDAITRADELLAYAEAAGFTLLASKLLTLSEEQVRDKQRLPTTSPPPRRHSGLPPLPTLRLPSHRWPLAARCPRSG